MARSPKPSTRTVLASWRALIAAQGRAQGANRAATQAAVNAALRRMESPYDPAAVAQFTDTAAAAVRAGRVRANDLTDAHLRRLLATVDVEVRARPLVVPEPRGLPIEDVMERAVKQYRWEVSEGRDEDEALERAARRAATIAETDVAMAARDAFSQITNAEPRVIGHRRVIHPELSAGGVCGLCIAAATRVYRKEELMPLHANCKCVPEPVIEGAEDFAQRINDLDLDELYIRIGETRRAELSNVRIRVEEHGETGPTLIAARHRFRDKEDVRLDAAEDTPIGDFTAA